MIANIKSNTIADKSIGIKPVDANRDANVKLPRVLKDTNWVIIIGNKATMTGIPIAYPKKTPMISKTIAIAIPTYFSILEFSPCIYYNTTIFINVS